MNTFDNNTQLFTRKWFQSGVYKGNFRKKLKSIGNFFLKKVVTVDHRVMSHIFLKKEVPKGLPLQKTFGSIFFKKTCAMINRLVSIQQVFQIFVQKLVLIVVFTLKSGALPANSCQHT